MSKAPLDRRRHAMNISLGRSSRLYQLVTLLMDSPRDRNAILEMLGIGLRTFYRELDLLRRCAIKIQRVDQSYILKTTPETARGQLPFPDPQLSFAEMAELANHPGAASQRLGRLLQSATNPPLATPKRAKRRGSC